jgi:hypothetical protein
MTIGDALLPGRSRPVDIETLWWITSIALGGLLIATLIALVLDPRSIGPESVWAKPIRFQLALALHFATLAIFVRGLSEGWRTGNLLLVVAVLSIASTIFEMAYIMVQAARQQASHFNLSTPFHATMYVLMAIGAIFIVGAAGVVGAIVAVDSSARFGDVLRTGIALGLVGGTVLTLVVAFTMGGRLDHHVGTAAATAARMPLTGWSFEVGDLRVPHFFATHMIQAACRRGFGGRIGAPRRGTGRCLDFRGCLGLGDDLPLLGRARGHSARPLFSVTSIDSMRPAPEGRVNSLVHKACLDLDITHIGSLCNLESLLGQGQFTFIGLPMKWRDGTASPIRAVAVFDM